MTLRPLIPSLFAAFTLASCALTPPLTPEQLKVQAAETAQARDYFAHRINITDDGGDSPGYSVIELKSTPEGGDVIAYYDKGKARPLFTDKVTECVGKAGPFPTLDCKLYDGIHRWVGITYTVVSEDTVITDPRLIPMQSHIKVSKGGLMVEIRRSPQSWRLAGRFAGQ